MGDEFETIYTTPRELDPSLALDVLAYVLAPTEVLCTCPEARAMLAAAKHEAARNWLRLQGRTSG